MGCSYSQNTRKKKPNEEYAPLQILQGIISSLIQRKIDLEQDLNIQSQNNNNNIKNRKLEYPKGYQKYIDQLCIEVDKLEKKKNKMKILNNSKTLINFYTMTGDIYIINVDNETKLGDAFKNAFYNKKFIEGRYTINFHCETRFTDDSSKINIEQLMFLLGGEDVSENFKNNEPVSSLVKDSNSSISILVRFPIQTQIIPNTNYNYNYY